MSQILQGVVHGKTIELTQPANLPEGGAVRVVLLPDAPRNGAGAQIPSPAEFVRCRTAFLRDLPSLLATTRLARKWVLYRRGKHIKTARTQRELVRFCQKKSWARGDYYVDMVVPHSAEPEVIEAHLHEIDG